MQAGKVRAKCSKVDRSSGTFPGKSGKSAVKYREISAQFRESPGDSALKNGGKRHPDRNQDGEDTGMVR